MKVLVVDDEPLVRRSLQRAFKAKGHDVDLAEDGGVGLRMLLDNSYDGVFLDVLMPQMTGPQVLQSLPPEKRQQMRIVLMSAFTGAIENQEATGLADHFLAKPFEDIFAIVKLMEEIVHER